MWKAAIGNAYYKIAVVKGSCKGTHFIGCVSLK